MKPNADRHKAPFIQSRRHRSTQATDCARFQLGGALANTPQLLRECVNALGEKGLAINGNLLQSNRFLSEPRISRNGGRMSVINDDVIAKITKLLARSSTERGATEAEAETAMRMALELLARHNLSMDQLKFEDVKEKEIREDELHHTSTLKMQRWAIDIATAAADLYFCDYITHISRTGRWRRELKHIFIGRSDNVIVAKEVADYLIDTTLRLSREGGREYAKSDPDITRRGRSRFERNFRKGCTARLMERAWSIVHEASQPAQTPGENTLPALRDLYSTTAEENKRYIGKHWPKLGKMRSARRDWFADFEDGWEEGQAAGDKINLKKPARRLQKSARKRLAHAS
jgi:hypothetical protein